jgi:hypothetical protein
MLRARLLIRRCVRTWGRTRILGTGMYLRRIASTSYGHLEPRAVARHVKDRRAPRGPVGQSLSLSVGKLVCAAFAQQTEGDRGFDGEVVVSKRRPIRHEIACPRNEPIFAWRKSACGEGGERKASPIARAPHHEGRGGQTQQPRQNERDHADDATTRRPEFHSCPRNIFTQ